MIAGQQCRREGRSELVLGNLALGQQFAVLQRAAPKPRLNMADRLFWRGRSSQTWQTFVRSHMKDLVAIDFLTVPTASFVVLFVFLESLM
jgi:hypothetical protein